MNAYRHFDADPLCDVFAGVDLHEALTRAPTSTYARHLLDAFEIDGFAHDGETFDDIELLAVAADGGDVCYAYQQRHTGG